MQESAFVDGGDIKPIYCGPVVTQSEEKRWFNRLGKANKKTVGSKGEHAQANGSVVGQPEMPSLKSKYMLIRCVPVSFV